MNITGQVEDCLRQSGVREGLCLVNAMHITASVFINDEMLPNPTIESIIAAIDAKLAGKPIPAATGPAAPTTPATTTPAQPATPPASPPS